MYLYFEFRSKKFEITEKRLDLSNQSVITKLEEIAINRRLIFESLIHEHIQGDTAYI